VTLSILVAAAVLARREPPRPKPADAPSSEFSATRAREVLRRLVGDGAPHPVGSDENSRVRDRVLAELARLGYAAEVQKAFVCGRIGSCATVQNVVARLPGRGDGKAVLVSAHYDSVGAGPGVSDDGMGVAALLEIARILRSEPAARNPILFLIDDGEEAGLLGAEAFASHHPWSQQIGAVVNLENRGTSGTSFLFETSDENCWLVNLVSWSIRRPATSSLFYTIYKRLPNDTDLTVFREHGLAGVNFAAIGGVQRYHTPLDDLEHASPSTLQHHGDNALAMARALAAADLSAPHRGNAVFFDLFGAGVVAWPEQVAPALAAAILGMLAIGLFLRWRSGALSLRASVWGVVGGLAMPLLAMGMSLAVARLLRTTGALPVSWIAHPGWLLAAVWTLALFGAGLVASVLARRAGPAGLWSGVWIWCSVLALFLAIAAAGLSFLFLVPAACAALSGLVAPRARAAESAAAIAPACFAAFFWLPTAWVLYDAIGSGGAAIIGAAVGVWAAAIAPLFAFLPAARRRAILGCLAGAATIALAGAALASPFSSEVPERMSILWHQDADTGRARWLLFPESNRISESTREAAGCSKKPISPYPWSGSSLAFAVEASTGRLRPPEFPVREDSSEASGRRLRAILRSARGAPVVFLALPPSASARVTIGGAPIPPISARWLKWHGGWTVLSCLTAPPEGVEVEIVASGDAPLTLYVGDRTRGLPAGGERLVRARGATGVPSQDGDGTLITRRLRL
jgi:hypothetical protein